MAKSKKIGGLVEKCKWFEKAIEEAMAEFATELQAMSYDECTVQDNIVCVLEGIMEGQKERLRELQEE